MVDVKKVRRRKKSLREDGLSLPTEPNTPPADLLEYTVVIYGRKGIGKTSLSAEFQDSLTFMFEIGRRNLSIKQVPQNTKERLSWSDFLEYRDLFLESDFNTACIDTLDRCYLACFDYVCHSKGVKHPQSLGREAFSVWDQIADEFEEGLRPLIMSDKGLVILSHDKERKTELATGEVLEMMEPSCKPAAYRFVQTVADFVLYYTYQGGGRAIVVRDPTGYIWCSCGVDGHFLNPDGTPINSFRVSSDSPMDAWKDLIKAYDNKNADLEYKPPSKRSKRLPKK